MSERVALVPGSFDPITAGHLDVVARARGLFDRVVVAVAAEGKAGWLSAERRLELVRIALAERDGCEAALFSGLLVDEVRRRGACAVVRGLRSAGDYEHEWALAQVNGILAPGFETVCLFSRPQLAAISSSLVREVARHGGSLDGLVPPAVAAALAAERGA